MRTYLEPQYRKLFPTWGKPYDFSNFEEFDNYKKETFLKEFDVDFYQISYNKKYENEVVYGLAFIFPRYSIKQNKMGYIIRDIESSTFDFSDSKGGFVYSITSMDSYDYSKLSQTSEMFTNVDSFKKILNITNNDIIEFKKSNAKIQQLTLLIEDAVEFDLLYKLQFDNKIVNIIFDYFDSFAITISYKLSTQELGFFNQDQYVSIDVKEKKILLKQFEKVEQYKILKTHYDNDDFNVPQLKELDPEFHDIILDVFINGFEYKIQTFNEENFFYYLYEDVVNVLIGKHVNDKIDITKLLKIAEDIQLFLYSMLIFILNKRKEILNDFNNKVNINYPRKQEYINMFIDHLYASINMNVLKKELKTNLLIVVDCSQTILFLLSKHNIPNKKEIIKIFKTVHTTILKLLKIL